MTTMTAVDTLHTRLAVAELSDTELMDRVDQQAEIARLTMGREFLDAVKMMQILKEEQSSRTSFYRALKDCTLDELLDDFAATTASRKQGDVYTKRIDESRLHVLNDLLTERGRGYTA